jgi:hypothetical protein
MSAEGWLADTRASYDTVADSYSDFTREALTGETYLRAALTLFADLVHAVGEGPVADVGCGPGHIAAHLHKLGRPDLLGRPRARPDYGASICCLIQLAYAVASV